MSGTISYIRIGTYNRIGTHIRESNMQKIIESRRSMALILFGLFLMSASLPLYSDDSLAPGGEISTETSQAGEEVTEPGQVSEPSQAGEVTEPSQASEPSQSSKSTETVPAPEPEAEKPSMEKKQSKNIVRALLTTGIENREPVDEIVSINKNQERIYFFTEIVGMEGKLVKHRWEYKGKIMGEVDINVGSPKWRCYSSKNILPAWTGIWTVSVVDDQDNVLAETYFEVTD